MYTPQPDIKICYNCRHFDCYGDMRGDIYYDCPIAIKEGFNKELRPNGICEHYDKEEVK